MMMTEDERKQKAVADLRQSLTWDHVDEPLAERIVAAYADLIYSGTDKAVQEFEMAVLDQLDANGDGGPNTRMALMCQTSHHPIRRYPHVEDAEQNQ